MTSNPTDPVPTPTPVRARTFPRVPLGLTPGDAERIASAIDAELAASTRTFCACAWRQ